MAVLRHAGRAGTPYMHAAICRKCAVYSRSPAKNPLHFADHSDESGTVSCCTFAEVPFLRPGGCAFEKAFGAANPYRLRRGEPGTQGARPLGTRPWCKARCVIEYRRYAKSPHPTPLRCGQGGAWCFLGQDGYACPFLTGSCHVISRKLFYEHSAEKRRPFCCAVTAAVGLYSSSSGLTVRSPAG